MKKIQKKLWVLLNGCLLIFLVIFILFLVSLRYSSKYYAAKKQSDPVVTMRKFPYPFKAGLAICSDIDGTDTLGEFLTIQEFLNTKNKTELGIGLDLEIGNSIFPEETGSTHFALVSPYDPNREVILDLIKLGYIDVIHSFKSLNRERIREVTDFLLQNGGQIKVWVNHAEGITDLGDHNYAQGDNVGSNFYHSDFSLKALGCQFIWMDEVTSIVGQGVPLRFHSFWDALDRRHLISSFYRNVIKEIGKYGLSFAGRKYINRKTNDLAFPAQLDDGQYVFEFIRSNVSYKGIGGEAATSGSLDTALRPNILERLAKNEAYMIVYTHLGVNDGYPYISDVTQRALRRLETAFKQGHIYVTTTKKLLEYYVNQKYLVWDLNLSGKEKRIQIRHISDPVRGTFIPSIDDLQGITFYTDDPQNTYVLLQNKVISGTIKNDKDSKNRYSIMIPLKPLPKIDSLMTEYKKKGYF